MDKHRLIVVSNRQPYEHRWESNELVCTRTDGGIDSGSGSSPSVEQAESMLRHRLGFRAGIRLDLGVDRLDYTKGLLKRLWALDEFFTQFPQFRGKFTFLRIAIPTRTEIGTYQLCVKSRA